MTIFIVYLFLMKGYLILTDCFRQKTKTETKKHARTEIQKYEILKVLGKFALKSGQSMIEKKSKQMSYYLNQSI